jgi:hypothetical protein
MSEAEIKGRVARIVSDREIIINRGAVDGVEIGMYFKVLDPVTEDILDPDDGTTLGSISRVKVVLEAAEVTDRLTLARTFRRSEVNIGGGGGAIGALFAPPKYVTKVETIRRDESFPSSIGESESIVKTGDPVGLATADEVDDFQSVSLWREARNEEGSPS